LQSSILTKEETEQIKTVRQRN